MSTAMVRFYRILTAEVPTLDDFLSGEAEGDEPSSTEDPLVLRMWQGISVYATETQARKKAKASRLGDDTAELTVPVDGPISFQRTGGSRARGHHTLWGEPTEIMARIVRVVPVENPSS